MDDTILRRDIFNLPLDGWYKLREIENDGAVETTPEKLMEVIGFTGGMFLSGLATEKEKEFIDEFYRIGRLKYN